MKLKNIILILAVIAFAGVVVSGSTYYFTNLSHAVENSHRRAIVYLKKQAEHIDETVNEHLMTLDALSLLPQIKGIFAKQIRIESEGLNFQLRNIQSALFIEELYVLNTQGLVVASSSYDKESGFIGRDLRFRPYFQYAIAGRYGVYLALDVVTLKKGLYLSSPIYTDDGAVPVGVLVMKDSVEKFKKFLPSDDLGLYHLVSPEGIIFISSSEKFEFKTLWQPDDRALEKITASRQFGVGPWEWSGINCNTEISTDHIVSDTGGNGYMAHKMDVPLFSGWNLVFLHDLGAIRERISKPMAMNVGLVVIAVCLLFSGFSWFLYSIGAKEITSRHEAEQKLKENEGRLSAFFQTAGAIILVISPEYLILEINLVAERFYGVEKDKMIGRNYLEFLPESARKPVADDISLVLRGKRTEDFENPVVGVNGEERIVLWNVNRLGDEISGVMGVVAIGQDITERKKVEVALDGRNRELDRVFRQVEKAKKEWEMTMDCINVMVFLVGSSDTILRLNRTFQDVTGKSYGEVLGSNWQQLLAECALLPEHLSPDGISEPFYHRSGRWFVLQKFGFGEGRGDNYTVVTISDVTEMTAVNQELELRNNEISTNRAKLQNALDELSAIIQRVAVEEDFRVRFENPDVRKCWEILKCGKEDCPCYGEGRLRCWQVAGTFCGGGVQGKLNQKKDGCIKCKVFKLATENPIYLIGEEFNNMMHILETKNNALQDAFQELKMAQSQILQQEKMASVGQLAAGVAHEINNPMGFIGSNLSSLGKYSEKLTEFIKLQGGMLEKINDPETMAELQEVRKKLKLDFIVEDMHDLITESLEGADRVKKIVMGLKNFSRVDQAAQQMADINECVESTLNVVWNELKYKCTVEKDYGDIPQIRCFPQQLNQVFMNLLVNGAQAIEDQGIISIKTRAEGGWVMVSISDTGCGISPENQKRVFEPFFTTKDVGKGTGLGMSIAYDIIEKHGGDILIDSEVGKGSVFTVRLPVV